MCPSRNPLFSRRICCPICGSSALSVLFTTKRDTPQFLEFLKFEKFYSKSFYDRYSNGLLSNSNFEITKCKECGLFFQSEVLNESGMFQLYNEWLDQELLLKYYTEKGTPKFQEELLSIVKKIHGNDSSFTVLDFGAGYGNFSAISKELGFHTYAFDLSLEKNSHLANKLGLNIISDLENFYSFFDFIYINQVLEHLSNPVEILSLLQKCLTKKGIIFLSVPNCNKTHTILKQYGLSNELFKQLSPHQHINAFNNRTLLILGKKSGLVNYNIIDFLRKCSKVTSFKELRLMLKLSKDSLVGTNLMFQKA